MTTTNEGDLDKFNAVLRKISGGAKVIIVQVRGTAEMLVLGLVALAQDDRYL